jgi:acetylornithine deacetylase/succinyl-diaminopimelate desuccinylase-like protein
MDIVELTKNLIEIQSISGNEMEISNYISEQLETDEIELQTVKGFGPNVIAKHTPDPEGPIILLNCHMDTVSVMDGWERDPFQSVVYGNKLYGLGSCDMKAGCAIAIDTFNFARRKEVNVIFTAVSDEEGNSTGSHFLLEKMLKEELGQGRSDVLCLIPEDTHEIVKLGARGRLVVEITIKGCSAHGATPECGTNAIIEAGKILDAIDKMPIRSHPQMGTGSFCVLKIEGGGYSLSVPDRCVIRVDRHTIPGEDRPIIMDDFENLMKNIDINCQYELSFMKRQTPFLEPYILEAKDPWAKNFLSAFGEFYKREPGIGYGRSVGDFNAFGKHIPTIVFGPAGENAHAPNECVYIDSVKRCRDFYLKFLEDQEKMSGR